MNAPAGTPAATTGDTPRTDIGGATEAVDDEVVVAAEVMAVVGVPTSLPEAEVSLVNKGTHGIALDGGITPNPLPNTTPDASPALDPDVPVSPDISLSPVPPLETSIIPPDVDVPSDPDRLLGPGVAPNTHDKSQYRCHNSTLHIDLVFLPWPLLTVTQTHSPPFHLY